MFRTIVFAQLFCIFYINAQTYDGNRIIIGNLRKRDSAPLYLRRGRRFEIPNEDPLSYRRTKDITHPKDTKDIREDRKFESHNLLENFMRDDDLNQYQNHNEAVDKFNRELRTTRSSLKSHNLLENFMRDDDLNQNQNHNEAVDKFNRELRTTRSSLKSHNLLENFMRDEDLNQNQNHNEAVDKLNRELRFMNLNSEDLTNLGL